MDTFTFCILLSPIKYTPVNAENIYDKPTFLIYIAPYSITTFSLVKTDTTSFGKMSTTKDAINPPTIAILIINPIIVFIDLISLFPQYCEFKTIDPDASPNIKVVKIAL